MWQAVHINLSGSVFRISISFFLYLLTDIVTEPGFVRRACAAVFAAHMAPPSVGKRKLIGTGDDLQSLHRSI